VFAHFRSSFGQIRDAATPKGKTMRDLYYHRALVLARSGRVDQALQDLNDGLVSDPKDYRVLKAKYRLEKVMETMEIPSMDYHGDHTRGYDDANPATAHDATAVRLVSLFCRCFVAVLSLIFARVLDRHLWRCFWTRIR